GLPLVWTFLAANHPLADPRDGLGFRSVLPVPRPDGKARRPLSLPTRGCRPRRRDELARSGRPELASLLAQAAERLREALASLQCRLEQVAAPIDPLTRLAHAEVARTDLLAELFPAERHRDRRARLRAHGVGRRDRLAVPVLAVVDEHATPLLLQPFRGDEARV